MANRDLDLRNLLKLCNNKVSSPILQLGYFPFLVSSFVRVKTHFPVMLKGFASDTSQTLSHRLLVPTAEFASSLNKPLEIHAFVLNGIFHEVP